MKYEVNEELVESFDIYDVGVKEAVDESRMRVLITAGLLVLFTIIVVGGIALSFKTGETGIFTGLLDATTNFVALAIGFYFGNRNKGDKTK